MNESTSPQPAPERKVWTTPMVITATHAVETATTSKHTPATPDQSTIGFHFGNPS